MLCRLFAGSDVLIPDPGTCANRNLQVLMHYGEETALSSVLALPLGSGCTEFPKQLLAEEVLAVLGMGLQSGFVCL